MTRNHSLTQHQQQKLQISVFGHTAGSPITLHDYCMFFANSNQMADHAAQFGNQLNTTLTHPMATMSAAHPHVDIIAIHIGVLINGFHNWHI